SRGHWARAATKASASASSADAMSRAREATSARRRPYDARAHSSALSRDMLFPGASGALSALGHGRDVGPHLDAAGRGRGAPRGPLEGAIEVVDLDDVDAAELLLRVDEGPVLHLALAAADAERRGVVRRLEAVAAAEDARLPEGLPVGAVGRPVLALAGGVVAGLELGV